MNGIWTNVFEVFNIVLINLNIAPENLSQQKGLLPNWGESKLLKNFSSFLKNYIVQEISCYAMYKMARKAVFNFLAVGI